MFTIALCIMFVILLFLFGYSTNQEALAKNEAFHFERLYNREKMECKYYKGLVDHERTSTEKLLEQHAIEYSKAISRANKQLEERCYTSGTTNVCDNNVGQCKEN